MYNQESASIITDNVESFELVLLKEQKVSIALQDGFLAVQQIL